MIYPVERIAKYIIKYSSENLKYVSNLRLQKILYFVQAEFLVSKNEPCFREDIYAWQYGPVVPSVYNKYRIFGSMSIPAEETDLDSYKILDDDKFIINEVVDECNKYSTTYLVQLTHEQKPWKAAIAKGVDHIISKDSIKNYFIGA